jgi:hypothetical protein
MPSSVDTPMAFGGQSLPAFFFDWDNGQAIAYTGVSAQSAALTTLVVMVASDTKCWIRVGTNPTAVPFAAGSHPVDPGASLVFGVRPGQKIAVIRETANGTLSILPAVCA